ncbi:hypothetical protein GLOIN_2v1543471 [Rhizophagus irregularis DAOM 181602=DAOM 197198]|uniref:Uncharacterized protein n=1 Tax=Rhizophagus irregularis (strain DAOM 181602 / DAOM 197198 / MUCL 43194) TaxID=747089 RepID=A0A2P4QJE6_RHIID|nr:hypothetical protein GLOIN_2v1543471 [Rhizophagus irregularis DAOM 181602=DAOM 197198]POG77740.1 hypothetical protein GLOIN_2v1543471 [Rhizophagus irregularis DAOM 181602=DAOM 197198]|eukprot:XP_025184606.1 hypothetical protein GLOIN_2v1543471 [Rhizophagus irregularis DAOM 181602=DAOM 197198]
MAEFRAASLSWNRSYPSKLLVNQLIWHANPDTWGLILYRTCSYCLLYDCESI